MQDKRLLDKSQWRLGTILNPVYNRNKVCGLSPKAVKIAATEIMAGRSNVGIAGGMESMSQAPHFIRGARRGDEISFAELTGILNTMG
ncbi:MAG: hypothetical protein Ct9H90mP14_3730 [Methanobacteriota archaeon]|nr:MAG: hypothetical protein Ct9H90mP14_3730 [Euryarchaeota archaeon]